MDEETRLASSNDKTLVSKLNQSFKANQFYEAARLDPNSFIVKHYAEPVTYFIEGFRVKNQNTIEDNILSLIKGSANPLIKNLFPEQQEVESNQNKKAQTIASIFRVLKKFYYKFYFILLFPFFVCFFFHFKWNFLFYF